jgi:uncharacterized membrane protein YbhN (UPF0104 family)
MRGLTLTTFARRADKLNGVTSSLLDAPACPTAELTAEFVEFSADPLDPHEEQPRSRRSSRRIGQLVMGALLAAGAALLVFELTHANLGQALAAARPWQLALAAGWISLSLVAAAYNLTGFSATRIPLRQGLLAQLAISGLRVVTPSAVSTPLVATRFLTRSGAPLSDAMATVAAAQGVQLIATFGVVAGIAAVTGSDAHGLPSGTWLTIAGAVVVGLVAAAVLVAGCSLRVRSWLREIGRSSLGLVEHAGRHPVRVAGGVLASAALTLTHILAFTACVSAAGGHAPLLTLAAIYLGAATAGSMLPTPGGIGGVEAALIAGLTAAGLSLPTATAATLLSRLISVWLPAVPGWWAAVHLRRAHLL